MKEETEKGKTNSFTTTIKTANESLDKNDYSADVSVDFIIDINNSTPKKSPDIEAIYLEIGDQWVISQDGVVCPSTEAEKKNKLKYFIKAPVARLLSGGWVQLKLSAKRRVWTKWSGDEYKEKYKFSGNVFLEIGTSEGTFKEPLHVQAECEEIPF